MKKLGPEEALLRQILAYARLRGWRSVHFRPARLYDGNGWRTAVSGDGAGFPDLVLVRGDRLVFAELKSETGQLTAEQEAWRDALRATHGECYLWRPSDWPQIEEVLR